MCNDAATWHQRLARLLGVPAQVLREETELRSFLSDCFARFDLSRGLQDHYGLCVAAADLRGERTVGDLVATLRLAA